MTQRDYDAALAEVQLDQLQWTARNVPPTEMSGWMRDTIDPELRRGAIRSLSRLHAWLGAVLFDLRGVDE